MYAQGEMCYACTWKHAMDLANAMYCYGQLCNDSWCNTSPLLPVIQNLVSLHTHVFVHTLSRYTYLWLHLTTIKALKSNKATYGCIVKAKDLNSIISLVTLKVIHLVLQASDARDQELRSSLSAARSCPKQGLHQHAAARTASAAVDLFELWLWNSGKTMKNLRNIHDLRCIHMLTQSSSPFACPRTGKALRI